MKNIGQIKKYLHVRYNGGKGFPCEKGPKLLLFGANYDNNTPFTTGTKTPTREVSTRSPRRDYTTPATVIGAAQCLYADVTYKQSDNRYGDTGTQQREDDYLP